ncbi:MAG: hypothetical protein WCB70_21925, partial [Xanthobacteraceae bacterium]
VADSGQHNREILFLNRGRDNGNGRRGVCDRCAGIVREMLPAQVAAGGDRDYQEADKQWGVSSALNSGLIGRD